MTYDVVIVGGGPAGLTAAIYAARSGRSVVILEKESFGGQIIYSPIVDNYPACPHISGMELANKITEQAMNAGAECVSAEVTGIMHAEGENFIAETDMGNFTGRTLILATGVRHRALGLPKENDLVGKGVSYCAVCDGAFYADKKVAVIGGGNSALKEAIFLAKQCKEVVVVHRGEKFKAEQALVNEMKKYSNISVELNKKVVALNEQYGNLQSIELFDNLTEKMENLPVDGIFVAIGKVPQSEPFALMGLLDDEGYYDFDETTITHIAGLFVAGDARAKDVRQLTTAVADGAAAGLAASEYLSEK